MPFLVIQGSKRMLIELINVRAYSSIFDYLMGVPGRGDRKDPCQEGTNDISWYTETPGSQRFGIFMGITRRFGLPRVLL